MEALRFMEHGAAIFDHPGSNDLAEFLDGGDAGRASGFSMALSSVPELIVTFSRKVANTNAENLAQSEIVQYTGQNSPRLHNSEELNVSVLLL